jgi:cytochrome c oxidase assembly protein subunit 15
LIVPLTILALVCTIIQVVFGTQVRKQIDAIASALGYQQREVWIANLSAVFLLHRSFSILLALVTAALIYKTFKVGNNDAMRFAILSGFVLLAEIAVGVTLAYFEMPVIAQPLHLLLASMLFSAQFAVLLNVFGKYNNREILK